MAKFLLNLFGGGSIVIGLLIIFGGLATASGLGAGVGLYIGSGLLLFGAPLLGFARVIEILEEVSANTRNVSIEQVIQDRTIREQCAPYIKGRKPAFSNRRVYDCGVNGERATFTTEPEAIAFVSTRLNASHVTSAMPVPA